MFEQANTLRNRNHRQLYFTDSCINITILLIVIALPVRSFCELAPHLISSTGCYLLSEVFCQDPVERYFSRQRNRGGGNDNPNVEQFYKDVAVLLQKQHVHLVVQMCSHQKVIMHYQQQCNLWQNDNAQNKIYMRECCVCCTWKYSNEYDMC